MIDLYDWFLSEKVCGYLCIDRYCWEEEHNNEFELAKSCNCCRDEVVNIKCWAKKNIKLVDLKKREPIFFSLISRLMMR